MSAFDSILKHMTDTPNVPLPDELKYEAMLIVNRARAAQRRGIEVDLSPYLMSLLRLRLDGHGGYAVA